MSVIPMGDERTNLLDTISMGGADCERFYRLAVGMRNIMLQLGGVRSMWEDALSKVRQMSEEVLKDAVLSDSGISEQQTPRPGVEPVKRPVQFGWVVPGWRQ